MSFLNELIKKREKLKNCQTVVTSLSGFKYLENKTTSGEIKMEKLPDKCPGFVVDKKLDVQISQILEYLYLSSQDVAQDLELLEENQITHVLSVGVDTISPDSSCNIKFKAIELLDEPTADLLKVLKPCLDFIESSKQENVNNRVLVHCNAGYSRAPTVIIAYLMTKLGYSLEESFNIVKEKRNIKPNDGFMFQLKNLERNVQLRHYSK